MPARAAVPFELSKTALALALVAPLSAPRAEADCASLDIAIEARFKGRLADAEVRRLIEAIKFSFE